MITDLVFGGLTGLIGGIAQKITDYKIKKLEAEMQIKQIEHELEMRKADAEIMREEWAQRTKIAEEESSSKDFQASFNEPTLYSNNVTPNEKQGWLLVVVDFLRGVVRPFLTLYLCGVVTLMYFRTDGATIDPQTVVNTVLYLTTTAVCWWFGSRGKHN